MALSLRQKQLDSVVKMLNLNHPVVSGGTADEEVYKVLVLDRFCRDILSPLVHLNELRKHGITLCLMIDNERQNIPDAPAIYFVQATISNIQKIILDASRGIYESLHLNFASSLPRSLLEELATGTLKNDATHRISKVYDQYLEFVTLDNKMFSLAQPNMYVQLNDPSAQDKEIEAVVDGIVNGLFSVLVTLGVIPVIRCARGGAAEMVASVLDTRLRDHLTSRNNLFTEAGHYGSSFQRPLLCLFDRNFELSVGVQHVWVYRPLVHDVLGMKLNRVIVQGDAATPGGKGKGAGKSFELDDSDSFWLANNSAEFPKVAEEVETQLNKYKQDIEEVNRRTGGSKEGSLDDHELLGHTKHLMSAVNSLPELTERKKMIDKHTNIATALLGEIKARHLDGFCSIEEDMLARGSVDKNQLLSILKGKGTKEDKLRLSIVYLLAVESTASTEIEAVETALREAEVDSAAFLYVKKIRSLNMSFASVNPGSRGNLVDWAEKLYGQSISAVTAGVKNLLSGGRQLALVRAVELLMEARPVPETESYLLFDPKVPKASGSGGHMARGPFKEAIVFMIGGGNYLEYGSLQDLAQRQQPVKNIIYGATEILTGKEFVDQLGILGNKMGVRISAAS
ncbi:hypothetical protein O6H91_07G077100 [Diphasiastrum complanatum]|uniref:Uncharacterized protein n=2 Tax=Diphasiastrum complanatum TaxID=34168 RepID=A0ACC2D7A6_DIPCM|nr:hypothetical protein O6H91_07G077100 [Diphasiastrum complanatum]KAJ7549980.1 hypothetical protein O6H91_07G077100 [Diphasiastrum complanatum]